MKKSVKVNQHFVGNDFRGRTTWSVADFSRMIDVVKTEYTHTNAQSMIDYLADLGGTEIKIEPTGERFGRAFLATYTVKEPTIRTFTNESAARAYARSL